MAKTDIFLKLFVEILNKPQNRVNAKIFKNENNINDKTWYRYLQEVRTSLQL